MRDLVLIGREHRRHATRAGPSSSSSSSAHGLAFDASSSTAYTVFHSPPSSSGIAAFQIYANQLGASSERAASLLIKVDLVASTSQLSPKEHGQSQVRSFTFLADGGSAVNDEPALCLITSGGDIVLIPTTTSPDAGPVEPQIVGSVEQGILAAAWSPDEEAVVLVVPAEGEGSQHLRTPIEKMLVMSREFEVLDEKLIREQGRGDGEWGRGTSARAAICQLTCRLFLSSAQNKYQSAGVPRQPSSKAPQARRLLSQRCDPKPQKRPSHSPTTIFYPTSHGGATAPSTSSPASSAWSLVRVLAV